jgi:Fe-S cluster assembly protein SufD
VDSEYVLSQISEHTGKNTESLIRTKSGLRRSKAIIKGLIRKNKDAESSSGYQKSDILLIDEESKGVSIPDLEIQNEQVKCTHGSTISRIDEEKIFYLQSRGLSKNEAETMMIEGFYDTILNIVSDKALREELKKEVIGI